MTIEEFLSNENRFSFPVVPTGSSSTVGEFFRKAIITPQNTETIRKWHHLLTRYANDPDAIILSRLYESVGSRGNWHNRRGMLTKMADGFLYACASNHFARVIFTMAYYNFVPKYSDFKEMLTGRKFSLSSNEGLTSVEKSHAAFEVRKYHDRFYTQGWYLAHIIAFKRDEYFGYPGIDIKDIITLGTESQWKNKGDYYVRELPDTLSADQKKIAKAQFLRFVDPINYFLVPGRYNSSIGNIGEKDEIVSFMRKKYFDTFGDDYKDFMKNALVGADLIPQQSIESIGRQQISVSFGLNLSHHAETGSVPARRTQDSTRASRPNQPRGAQNRRSQFTNHEKALCLKAYLFDGVSCRGLERDILQIESKDRGGGYKALTMMRNFGLVSDNKGMFGENTLEGAISQSSGAIKTALEFIRDNL